jgi:phosphohistidine phosphatase
MDLMLLRHGKSDWGSGARDDHSRPLATRGVRSAERMGEVLRDLDLIPDIVVSSTATRARSTAELARINGGWNSRLILEDALYGASVDEALAVAAQYGQNHERVMLVGHEPTWSMTVRRVTGAHAEIKTGTCAVMEIFAGNWVDVPRSSGSLVTLLQPRHFLS